MKKDKLKQWLSIILLTCILLAVPSAVLADIAPPANPPGVNPQPDSDTTQVRMAAETVQIDVIDDGYLGRAHVTADFTMRNLGTESESMAARFPISVNDGMGNYPEIKDLVIKVNGQQISYQRAIIRYQNENIPWAEFNVIFPVGKDVPIQVSYNLSGSGYMPYTAFYYILETGAGWKDTIGSADVILRLPYEPNPQNMVINMEIGWGKTTSGGVIKGKEMRWHFDNFEPGPDGPVQNMEFSMVAPVTWKNIINERDNVAKNPKDSEAWGRLAKAYKEIFFLGKGFRDDEGGKQLYQLSVEAYEKCLALDPKDAQWHAGFAQLLADRSFWDGYLFTNEPNANTYHALKEIQTALQLAPNDPKVLEIAYNIYNTFPDGMILNGSGFDFPWLTQTPVPQPTPTQAPILPTEATVLLDPQVVSGTYQSDILTLGNNKKLKLTLTLRPDQSAEWVSAFENEATIVSKGTWKDSGKGWLYIDVEAPNKAATVINGITVEGDTLHFSGYKLYYGDPGSDITMKRVITATPVPRSTNTPQSTSTESTPTAPSSKPSLPFCGSAALIGVVWLAKKRK
ncbi:MAG: hypothetical protein HZB50_00430 [Chloroflexi bacterium]|nr:hypothetical protein [Chloroflexota bacterium]